MKRKKYVFGLIVCIVVLLNACGKSTGEDKGEDAWKKIKDVINKDTGDESEDGDKEDGEDEMDANEDINIDKTEKVDKKNENEALNTDKTDEKVNNATVEKIEINPFKDLKVDFIGWNRYGTLVINTDGCESDVKKYVDFSYDIGIDGKLWNRKGVTIYATTKNDSYILSKSEEIYEVRGLYYLGSIEDYSDGIAWFEYGNSDGDLYLACMDKSGTALFQYREQRDEEMVHTPFLNGKAMIVKGSEVNVIDKTGTVQACISGGNPVYLCSEYCIMWERISDFDNNYNQYSMYDTSGNIVHIEKSDYFLHFEYLGNHVMRFHDAYYSLSDTLYFFESGQRIDRNRRYEYYDYCGSFTEGYIVITRNNCVDTLSFIDNQGNEIERSLGEKNAATIKWIQGEFHDGVVVLWEGSSIGYYNYADDKFVDGTDALSKYKGKIDLYSSGLQFSNGIIFFQMRGADGERYIAVFDKNWGLIFEPTKSAASGFWANGFWVQSENSQDSPVFSYYNSSAELLFTTDICLEYSENIAFTGYVPTSDFGRGWVNENNEVIFNTIDISNLDTANVETNSIPEIH